MDRRNFLKTVAQAAAVAAVAPKTLLDAPKIIMGVDTGLAEDYTSVIIWRAHNDLYYYAGRVMIDSPRTMFRLTNMQFPEPEIAGRSHDLSER